MRVSLEITYNYLPTYLPTDIPFYVLAYLPTFLPTYVTSECPTTTSNWGTTICRPLTPPFTLHFLFYSPTTCPPCSCTPTLHLPHTPPDLGQVLYSNGSEVFSRPTPTPDGGRLPCPLSRGRDHYNQNKSFDTDRNNERDY